MERIQFYPDTPLAKALKEDARKHGVAVSTLVVGILQRYYGLVPISTLSEHELNAKVFSEVKAYISELRAGVEFDLNSSSPTFAEIEMEYAGKPSTIRAKIGKCFAKMVGEPGDFARVAVKYRSNGKIKRTVNNATIYQIVKDNT